MRRPAAATSCPAARSHEVLQALQTAVILTTFFAGLALKIISSCLVKGLMPLVFFGGRFADHFDLHQAGNGERAGAVAAQVFSPPVRKASSNRPPTCCLVSPYALAEGREDFRLIHGFRRSMGTPVKMAPPMCGPSAGR